jgi:Holliday junction resolvase RusA-like endonuclease
MTDDPAPRVQFELPAERDGPPAVVVSMSSPPSLNRLWSTMPGKKRVRSQEYNAWLHTAGWEVRSQIVGMKPIDCRFDVLIEVPISRRDSGNWEKAVMDNCEHAGLVANDGNAHSITIRPTHRADVMVAIWPLPTMGGVRKAAKPMRVSRPRARKNKPGLNWIRP